MNYLTKLNLYTTGVSVVKNCEIFRVKIQLNLPVTGNNIHQRAFTTSGRTHHSRKFSTFEVSANIFQNNFLPCNIEDNFIINEVNKIMTSEVNR